MIMVMVKKDNFDGHSDYYGDGYYGSFIIMIIEYYDGNDNGESDLVFWRVSFLTWELTQPLK